MLNTIKGWLGEKITTTGMWAFLDKNTYHRIDNIIIPAPDGTTQIDHVLVSIYGIFVIETKNIKGWIFGDAHHSKWTQVIYGKKHSFQNPIRQNYRHTKCLSEYLQLDHGIFHPIVFFIGECEFKTQMPENVMHHGLIPYIKTFDQVCLIQEELQHIEATLNTLKQDPSLNTKQHLTSLRNRHELTTVCPRCGGQLVQRISKKGTFAGKPFWGCNNFPECKFTKKSE